MSSQAPPPGGRPPASQPVFQTGGLQRLGKRLLWGIIGLALFVAVSYGLLIGLWVLLKPRW